MGRKGKNKKQSPPSSVASSSSCKDYDKLVYVSVTNYKKEAEDTWITIDANGHDYEGGGDDDWNNGIIKFDLVPEMEIPENLAIRRLKQFKCCLVIDSFSINSSKKIYFIGGQNGVGLDYGYYSKKVFSYDISSKQWAEEVCQLNVGRAEFSVVVIDSVIYVFGGVLEGTNKDFTKEQWIECYNLNVPPKKRKWEFLSPTSSPPTAVFQAPRFSNPVVYQRGCQILFLYPVRGIYSFNYVTKTWKDCSQPNLKECALVLCDEVAVIEDVMFRHCFGTIYGYNLITDELVLTHSVGDFVQLSFAHPDTFEGETSFLVRVSRDTLLLICWNTALLRDDEEESTKPRLHCYRFRVRKYPSSPDSNRLDIHLIADGSGFFHTPPAYSLNHCLLV